MIPHVEGTERHRGTVARHPRAKMLPTRSAIVLELNCAVRDISRRRRDWIRRVMSFSLSRLNRSY